MLDKTLFEDYGLYRRCPFPELHKARLSKTCPAIQRYCTVCKGERTWHEDTEVRRRVGRPSSGKQYPLDDMQQPLGGCYVAYQYICSDCHQNCVIFIIYFGSDVDLNAEGATLEEFAESSYMIKVGQFPPWSIDPPTELRMALGPNESTFRKGAICESQGYGIGAFAYYRRIVENIIDEMLRDIGDLLETNERKTYKAALDAVRTTTVAQEKIGVVKDLLPSFLRPGEINPLALLHDALSVGIHALDEDDCLALADGLRTSLTMLAKHIALAKQDKAQYTKSIRSVKDRLDKIKQRSKNKG